MTDRVALDLGATAPSDGLAATRRVLDRTPDLEIVLVGPADLAGEVDGVPRLSLRSATGRLSPEVPADVAVRGQPDLPVRVAVALLAEGEVDRVVSASPVSALTTAARFLLPRAVGVRDLLLARTLRLHGPVVVLDAAGNRGIPPATLARTLAAAGLGARVGVLRVGDRPSRADEELLAPVRDVAGEARLVTIHEVLADAVDVVVTDGIAGRLLVDLARALAPEAVGPGRLVGLDHHAVLSVADDGPEVLAMALSPAGVPA